MWRIFSKGIVDTGTTSPFLLRFVQISSADRGVAALFPPPKEAEMAPAGQTRLHAPQRMHSGLLTSLVTSTPMGQARSHFLHWTHLL